MTNLTSPIFSDENAARRHLEAIRWPDGPYCPRCGSLEGIAKKAGASSRQGVYRCNTCRREFTVTVGTLYGRSHIPLHKWILCAHLLGASKKGMSTHQLHRMLGVTYKTAWFMTMRIREGMRDLHLDSSGPLGGANKVLEADETHVGGKAKNRKNKIPPKEAVFALVERGGKVRSPHVPDVSAKTLRAAIVSQTSRMSYLVTDEAPAYRKTGEEFSGHGTVNHSIEEYVRGDFLAHKHGEELFQHLQARDYRNLSPRQPEAPQAVSRRVRLPLQRAGRARSWTTLNASPRFSRALASSG